MNEWSSTGEAAKVLGVNESRVRALAGQGRLPAEKIGGRWLIRRSDLRRLRASPNPSGRPLTAQNAWATLLLASGEPVEGIDPSVLSRLKRTLRQSSVIELAPRLRLRAQELVMSAHPGEIHHILDDEAFLPTGVSATDELMTAGEAEGYVIESDLHAFTAGHALSSASSDSNVRIRVVPNGAEALLAGRSHAPAAAVALDLLQSPDPRASRIGEDMANGLR